MKKEMIKKKVIRLKQMSGPKKQILELTLNAPINGILIKPREKGGQNLGVSEPFKFSLVSIVDPLSSLKCLRKIGKILNSVSIIIGNT